MNIRLALLMMPNAFSDAGVKVTPDFSLIVTPCISHYFFGTNKTTTLTSKHNISKITFIGLVIVETVVDLLG